MQNYVAIQCCTRLYKSYPRINDLYAYEDHVDSWVQPVTCVSVVFHSGNRQQVFGGVMAPTPKPPSVPHPLFLFYRNWLLTGALQASLMLEKNPGAAAVAAVMHSERMCPTGFSERIALVTEETLSLMLLDGHGCSPDQKLPQTLIYPSPPWPCSVVKTIQKDSPWTCSLTK